jgi:H+/Na+-translocating ferredoxin:NAD+ oxidoreductase subunit D
MERRLIVSSSPHVHAGSSSARIMWTVTATLAPAAAWSTYLFGIDALQVILSTVLFAIVGEALACLIAKKPLTILDGSAVLTGMILALSLPPGLPIWICAIGGLVATVIAKAVFGGLGQNPFNPAMTGRVFLLIAFPGQLTRWLVPRGTGEELLGHSVTAYNSAGKVVEISVQGVDVITAATPLGLLAENGASAVATIANIPDLFFGNINGSLGETSVLFLGLGGLFLLWRKIITWHIPVSFLGTVALVAAVSYGLDDAHYCGPVFHLFTGATVIGAFFIATDYVTSPMHPRGKLIFGVGCGVLTMVIRLWAGYPEGVSFAVLLMNAAVPIIDNYTRPKKFGIIPTAPKKEVSNA